MSEQPRQPDPSPEAPGGPPRPPSAPVDPSARPVGQREHWGTRIGVILAVMGSAVGLGNFLRFPGWAAQYEGGAFMIPYFIALLILGLPIALAEWSLGRYAGRRGYNSPPGIFRAVWKSPLAPYVGALSAVVPVMIYMYYIHVEAWCLYYAILYASGNVIEAKEGAGGYGGLLGALGGAGEHGSLPLLMMGAIAFSFILNFVLIYRGVRKGIELFVKFAMPLLILCAVIILVRVLTLPPLEDQPERNVLNGLAFMWNPNWALLTNAQMWIDATGQIFFTLSVGFGLIVTYASYVKPDDDIALSAVTSASGNQFCEVALAGMMVIPAAFIFLGPADVKAAGEAGSSLGLGFAVLPNVFEQMGAIGPFIGFLFFFLLFLAAVTSSLSMLQPAIAMLEEGLGLGRKASVSLLGFITAIGAAFIGYFSAGFTVLDTVDFWVGNFALYVLATIMVLVFGWVLGIDKGKAELDRGAEIRIPGFVMFIIKYIAPVYLIGVMAVWVFQNVFTADEGEPTRIGAVFSTPIVAMAVGFIAVVVTLFLFLAGAASARWRRRELEQTEVSP